MLSVKTTFQARALEVETYFTFLKGFLTSSVDGDLNKILKANLILMLYNTVESTVSNSIEEIHADIHRKNTSFNDLQVELKKSLIKFMKSPKSQNPHDFVLGVSDLAVDIVKKCFNKEKISNGNIDEREIAQLSRVYGFSLQTNYALTKNGRCLSDIRGRRNDLAHGTFSFKEVGEKYTVEDLGKMKDETINYLTEVIGNIETYLANQDYIIPPAVAV